MNNKKARKNARWKDLIRYLFSDQLLIISIYIVIVPILQNLYNDFTIQFTNTSSSILDWIPFVAVFVAIIYCVLNKKYLSTIALIPIAFHVEVLQFDSDAFVYLMLGMVSLSFIYTIIIGHVRSFSFFFLLVYSCLLIEWQIAAILGLAFIFSRFLLLLIQDNYSIFVTLGLKKSILYISKSVLYWSPLLIIIIPLNLLTSSINNEITSNLYKHTPLDSVHYHLLDSLPNSVMSRFEPNRNVTTVLFVDDPSTIKDRIVKNLRQLKKDLIAKQTNIKTYRKKGEVNLEQIKYISLSILNKVSPSVELNMKTTDFIIRDFGRLFSNVFHEVNFNTKLYYPGYTNYQSYIGAHAVIIPAIQHNIAPYTLELQKLNNSIQNDINLLTEIERKIELYQVNNPFPENPAFNTIDFSFIHKENKRVSAGKKLTENHAIDAASTNKTSSDNIREENKARNNKELTKMIKLLQLDSASVSNSIKEDQNLGGALLEQTKQRSITVLSATAPNVEFNRKTTDFIIKDYDNVFPYVFSKETFKSRLIYPNFDDYQSYIYHYAALIPTVQEKISPFVLQLNNLNLVIQTKTNQLNAICKQLVLTRAKMQPPQPINDSIANQNIIGNEAITDSNLNITQLIKKSFNVTTNDILTEMLPDTGMYTKKVYDIAVNELIYDKTQNYNDTTFKNLEIFNTVYNSKKLDSSIAILLNSTELEKPHFKSEDLQKNLEISTIWMFMHFSNTLTKKIREETEDLAFPDIDSSSEIKQAKKIVLHKIALHKNKTLVNIYNEFDALFPEPLLEIKPAFFLDIKNQISNAIKRSLNKKYSEIKGGIKRMIVLKVIEVYNEIEMQAQKGFSNLEKNTKDITTENLGLNNINITESLETAARTTILTSQKSVISSYKVAFTIWFFYVLLGTLTFTFLVIRTFMYIFARVTISRENKVFITLNTQNKELPQGEIKKHGDTYTIPAEEKAIYYVSYAFEPSGRPPRFSIPFMFTSLLPRLKSKCYTMNKITMNGEGSPAQFRAIGSNEFIEWDLKDGEGVVFNYENLVAVSSTVKLKSVSNLMVTTLILGQVFHKVATGPGKIVLMSKGRPIISGEEEANSSVAKSRILAWGSSSRFDIDSTLSLKDVYMSDFYLHKMPSDLIIIDADAKGKASYGLIQYIKGLVWPL